MDRRLAGGCGVDAGEPAALARWRASHRPLHWAVAFPAVMAAGGFDAIVGNPPYVEYHRVKSAYTVQGYATASCGNLYAYVVERALALLAPGGRAGLVVPISLVGTERMAALRECVAAASSHVWTSHYDVYPTRLFARAKQRLSVLLLRARAGSGEGVAAYSTRYNRWYPAFRPYLMTTLQYWPSEPLGRAPWLKLGSELEWRVWRKLVRQQPLGAALDEGGAHTLLVHRIPYNFVKAITFIPYFHSARDGAKKSEDYKPYGFRSCQDRDVALAAVSSSLFFWYWYARYEGYHCGRHEIAGFSVGLDTMSEAHRAELGALAGALVESLRRGAWRRRARYAHTGSVEYDELYPRRCKTLLDRIDRVLGEHYGLTEEELDFVVHHDLKYRMGLPGSTG